MKNKIVLFFFLLFSTALCAGLYAHINNSSSSLSKEPTKNKHLQKLDHQSQTELYSLSDVQDDLDSDDLEKVKFDYAIGVREYISCFFETSFLHTQPLAVPNYNYTSIPRYILYHALQIAGR
ncbi:hypothetical protein LZQ00_16180 [Sphingobacterium sp. SRCM116780]|uniref:hypothetical protein n=1 Tax=Sphingobacterium sp. SRCM116780 TaxID=2907623 RepID=UPI001F2481E3|nr:hypothetical protein [Sphingobacterium sp. SRCM116780]UIR55791.1 hypothetical protein LZQ00_16180 [Sphingobacterium sp. SRCM116780]